MAFTAEDNELYKHLQLTLASKNQKIAELQTQPLRLYDYCWSPGIAPNDLLRSADAVVDDDQVIYLRHAKSQPSVIHRYNVLHQQWLESVQCNFVENSRFSMIYHQQVIMVGGFKVNEAQCSNKIFVHIEQPNTISTMPTERCRTTALKYIHEGKVFLIVIGGENSQGEPLKTVEILDLTNLSAGWKPAKDIPEALSCSSGTIVNGVIFLLGGWSKRDVATSSVFACSVERLIASADPNHTMDQVWDQLPDLPVQEAACTSFKGCVMVVGGRANTVAVHDIRTYNEFKKRWDVIGYLPHPRYNCFAIGLADKLIVIGGGIDKTSSENTIEVYQDK